MFNPSENDALDRWFQRLNTPLKRLPAEERASLHLEVRQHLESLVAANEELGSSPQEAWEHALSQFGDPTRIGRRLAREWRRGQSQISPDMAAVLYGLGAQVVSVPILFFCTALVMVIFHLDDPSGDMFTVELFVGVPILAGAAVGRRFPDRALTGALYAVIAWAILLVIAVDYSDLLPAMLLPTTWLMLGCGSAYLASAHRRRQWYRPRLADFALRLPGKRPQIRRR